MIELTDIEVLDKPIAVVTVPVSDVDIPEKNCWVLLVVDVVDSGNVALKTSVLFIDVPEFVKQPLSNLIFTTLAFDKAVESDLPSNVFDIESTYVALLSKIGSKYSPVILVSSALTVTLS